MRQQNRLICLEIPQPSPLCGIKSNFHLQGSRRATHLYLDPMPRIPFLVLTLASTITGQSTNDAECRVQADPDTLGLGVRLGLYFQLLSTFFVALSRHNEARDAFVPTVFFFTGFIVAVLYSIATQSLPPGAIIACTWYPILLWVALFCVDFTDDTEIHAGGRLLWALVLWGVSGGLNIWFWFHGVHLKHEGQCMEPRVFFFANLGALGGVRIFFAFCSVFFIAGLVGSFVYFWWFTREGMVEDVEGNRDVEDGKTDIANTLSKSTEVELTPSPSGTLHLPSSTSKTCDTTEITIVKEEEWVAKPPERRVVQSAARTDNTNPQKDVENELKMNTLYGSVMILAFYVIASELQLRWNHLEGINRVDSTGQIIPLTLGSLALLRSIYLLKYFKKGGKKRDEQTGASMQRPQKSGITTMGRRSKTV